MKLLSTQTRWVGAKRPRHATRKLAREDSVAQVELRAPTIIVCEVERVYGDHSERSIHLTVEQDGVVVRVHLSEPDALLSDLTDACEWVTPRP